MRNDTMKKKIVANIAALKARIQPIQDELDLQQALLDQLNQHEAKVVKNAEATLGLELSGGSV